MAYTYPEIRDALMILVKSVQDGTLTGNKKYAGKAILTIRNAKEVNVLINFLKQNSVNSSIEEQSMGDKVVLVDFGQNKAIDTTMNEMAADDQHMRNVANRILWANFNVDVPYGHEPR